jgi:hypothetical protein
VKHDHCSNAVRAWRRWQIRFDANRQALPYLNITVDCYLIGRARGYLQRSSFGCCGSVALAPPDVDAGRNQDRVSDYRKRKKSPKHGVNYIAELKTNRRFLGSI